MACLDANLVPKFATVSLSVSPFLKGWPFQYFETLRWKYLDTIFVIGSTCDIGHFRLWPILSIPDKEFIVFSRDVLHLAFGICRMKLLLKQIDLKFELYIYV